MFLTEFAVRNFHNSLPELKLNAQINVFSDTLSSVVAINTFCPAIMGEHIKMLLPVLAVHCNCRGSLI